MIIPVRKITLSILSDSLDQFIIPFPLANFRQFGRLKSLNPGIPTSRSICLQVSYKPAINQWLSYIKTSRQADFNWKMNLVTSCIRINFLGILQPLAHQEILQEYQRRIFRPLLGVILRQYQLNTMNSEQHTTCTTRRTCRTYNMYNMYSQMKAAKRRNWWTW